MIALALATFASAAWLYLLLGRGGFWRARPRDEAGPPLVADAVLPTVVALIPARNEAQGIRASVASLLAQDYPGPLSVVVIDDESTDATAAIALDAARACNALDRFTALRASARPHGWTGKLWALQCGLDALSPGSRPDYVLFTDADIVHARDNVRSLVGRAERDGLGLVSIMARLRCVSFVERAFIPAFVFFFAMLYPFDWINRRDRRSAGAAGGCMLLRRAALEDSGGLGAIGGAIIDDCALARRIKMRHALWLGLSDRVHSTRACESLSDIRNMIVRSAYAQLHFSPVLLASTVLAMIVTYLAPPILAITGEGPARVLGVCAWGMMALALQPTLRFYRVSSWWGLALPVIALMYVVFTLDSAWQAMRGRAGAWKGRVYPVDARRALPRD
jgi:hopene-associated glycosyltransferase HpnB